MHHLYSAHDLLLGNVFLMSLLLFFMGVMLYLILDPNYNLKKSLNMHSC